MEKIKDVKVKHAILDCLHTVTVMSINPNATIDYFKAHGGEMVVDSFDNLQPSVIQIKYFWAYHYQLGK
jgi:hypothetical protein